MSGAGKARARPRRYRSSSPRPTAPGCCSPGTVGPTR